MIFITVRNSSCGKVMVSQTSVCPQLGGCVRGHCSGRYASYWNAFLCNICLFLISRLLLGRFHVLIVLLTDNLSEFYIVVGNNSDGSSAEQCAFESNAFAPSETRVYTCPCGMFGRYNRIRYPVDRYAYLQLCEVQVQAGGKEHDYNTMIRFLISQTYVFLPGLSDTTKHEFLFT